MSAVRGAFTVNFVGTAISFAVHLGSLVVISRLLTPAEIGIYAVSISVIGLLVVMREFGAGAYIIQRKEIPTDVLRSVIGVAAVMSWTTGAAIFLAAGPIADFYDQPTMTAVIRIISLNFFMAPFLSGVFGMLRRKLQFAKAMVIDLSNSATAAITGIALAFMDFGVLSLAFGSIAGTLASVVVATVFRPAEMPLIPGLRHWREVTSFGGKMVFGNAANQVGRSAPDLIIGRMLGMEPVAILSRANAFRNMIVTQLMQVLQTTFIPIFAMEMREEKDVRQLYYQRNELITVLLLTFYAAMIPLCGPLILLFFGHQWLPAIPIAQAICVVSLPGCPMLLINSMLTARGAVGDLARLQTTVLCARVLAVTIGGFFGLIWVAWLMVLEPLVLIAVGGYFMRRHFDMGVGSIFLHSWKSAVVALAAGLAAWAAIGVMPDYTVGEFNAFYNCLAGGAACGFAGLAMAFATRHRLAIELAETMAKLLAGRSIRRS